MTRPNDKGEKIKKESVVRKLLIIIALTTVFLFETVLYGCTGFCISQGDTVLVGNNED